MPTAKWVGTWAAAPAPAEGVVGFNNHHLAHEPARQPRRQRLRVRISNAYGTRPLTIGAAHIALRDQGPAIVAGSDRTLKFGGSDGTVIAAGAVMFSEPVELGAPALADLAVSLYLPGEVLANFAITGRYARQTNYISPPGNFAAETGDAGRQSDRPVVLPVRRRCGGRGRNQGGRGARQLVDRRQHLDDRRVLPLAGPAGAPLMRQGGRPVGVMNNGLGGNRILHDIRGDSGLRRFDRDVLAQPGVTHVIVMLGTNDLRNRWAKPEEEVTAEQMIAGLKQMAVRAHSAGIKIIGATLTPFGNETFMPNAWNPTREKHRVAVNNWVREGGAFDGGRRFRRRVARPRESRPRCGPAEDCGDDLHPSDTGYCKMGDANRACACARLSDRPRQPAAGSPCRHVAPAAAAASRAQDQRPSSAAKSSI